MGGICSRRFAAESTTDDGIPHSNTAGIVYPSHRLPTRLNSDPMESPAGESTDNQLSQSALSFPKVNTVSRGAPMDDIDDGIPRLSRDLSNKSRSTRSKQVAIAKVSEVSSLLGRAGTAGLGKAVDVLDTLCSSMTNLNLSRGFASSMATKESQFQFWHLKLQTPLSRGPILCIPFHKRILSI